MNPLIVLVFALAVLTTSSFTISTNQQHRSNARIATTTTTSCPTTQPSSTQLYGFENEAIASFMAEVTAVQEAVVAAGVAAFAGLAISSTKKKDDDSKGSSSSSTKTATKEPKVDVSVPYDAAALLEYNIWKGTTIPYDDVTFMAFKTIYEEKTVAEVCAKRTTRELQEALKKSDDQLAALLKKITTTTST